MYQIPGFADNNTRMWARQKKAPKPRPQSARARLNSNSTPGPGPGAYNPLHPIGHRMGNASIKGSCARDDSMTVINYRKMLAVSPGPAAYKPNHKHNSESPGGVSIMISQEGNVKPKIIEKSPGPIYKPPLPKNIPNCAKFRFGKADRVTMPKDHRVPGPGAYETLNPKQLGKMGINGHMGKPNPKIPKSYGRPLPMEGNPNQSPGPCQYSARNSMHGPLGRKPAKCTFGTASRFGAFCW